MTTETDIINDCLATLGESPIDTGENHPLKPRIMRVLAKSRASVLGRGWHFNVRPYPITSGQIHIVGTDALSLRTGSRSMTDYSKGGTFPWLFIQDNAIVDMRTPNATELTDTGFVDIVYDVPSLPNIPDSIVSAIGALTVLRFQSDYDADTNRREELRREAAQMMALAVAEDIRIRKVNLMWANVRLSRIKRVARRVV